MPDQGRLHLRLFLEGIEVSVINATVTATAGAPASANIQVVYTPEVRKLLPRTLVHLFFYDNDAESPEYRLLFCGDLDAITVSKSEGSRNVTLSCVDHRGYYEAAYVFFVSTGDLSSGENTLERLMKNRALFTNANTTTFVGNAGGAQISSLISDIFSNPKPSYLGFSHLDGALGGIIKSIETFTGIRRRGGSGAVNTFYAYNAARLQLLGQIGMYPNDYTSKKVLSAESIRVLLDQRGQQLGDLVSLNELIEFILGFIYHRSVPNPCAPYFPPSEFRADKTVTSSAKVKEAAQELIRYLDLVASQVEWQGTPLKAVDEARGGLRVILTITDFDGGDGAPYRPKDPLITLVASLDATSTQVAGYAQGVNDASSESPLFKLLKTVTPDTDAQLTLKICSIVRSLVTASELLYPFSDGGTQMPPSLNIEEVWSLITKAKEQTQAVVDGFDVEYDAATAARLYTTYMVPDLFFGVAPRCNVLFPDQYFTTSYSRNINAEITRLALEIKDDLTQANRTFQRAYYAPATTDLTAIQGSPLSDDGNSAILANKLLDHEVYTGIVPAFTSIQVAALQAAFPEIEQDRLYTSIANYRFLQKRLQQRRLNVSGTLNPYAAVGFPMVVIDSVDVEANQYIGLLTSITHSVTQQGGNTSYQLEYARPHTADDDPYITAFGDTKRTTSNEATLRLNTSEIAESIYAKMLAKEDYSADVALIRFIAKNSTYVDEGTHLIEPRPVDQQTGKGYKVRQDGTFQPYSEYTATKELKQFDTETSAIRVKQVDVTLPGAFPVSELNLTIPAEKSSLNEEHVISDMLGIYAYLLRVKASIGGTRLATASLALYLSRYLPLQRVLEEAGIFSPSADAGIYSMLFKRARSTKELREFAGEPLDSNLVGLLGLKAASTHQSLPIDDLSDDEVAVLVVGALLSSTRCLINLYSELSVSYVVENTEALSVPIEEALRPLFIHGAFSSPKIGSEVYTPLLGVKSIVDDPPEGAPLQDVQVVIEGESESTTDYLPVMAQQDAIDAIVTRYADAPYAPEFARNFIKRPIATIEDVLEDADRGFHYKAYSDAESIEEKEIPFLGNAFEIADGQPIPDGQREIGLAEQERLKQERVDDRVDVRVSRSNAVRLYVNSLQSRGLRG